MNTSIHKINTATVVTHRNEQVGVSPLRIVSVLMLRLFRLSDDRHLEAMVRRLAKAFRRSASLRVPLDLRWVVHPLSSAQG